jgi:hypothetical protein
MLCPVCQKQPIEFECSFCFQEVCHLCFYSCLSCDDEFCVTCMGEIRGPFDGRDYCYWCCEKAEEDRQKIKKKK